MMSSQGIGRIAVGSLVGTAIEFYDFYLYSTAAALVLNTTFFPNLSPVNGTLAAFSTFAVAFIGRPLGSLLFGHFGDRIGRKSTLVASLLTMGLATVLIGLLPGYASIGVAAPVLLVVLRFLQGIGLGGEWGGAALLAAENAPARRRGWFAIFPQLGPSIGFFAANGLFLLLSNGLSDAAFRSWGWRIPFLASALLVVVGLVVRLRLVETPAFVEVLRGRKQSSMPLVDMLRRAPVRLLLGSGTIIGAYVVFYVTTAFGLSYVTTTLKLPRTEGLTLLIIAVWGLAIMTVVSCIASDRLGRKPVLLAGGVFTALVGVLMFPLLSNGSAVAVGIAFTLGLAAMGSVYGPLGAFLPELFDVRYRYSAASFAYNLGGVLGGSLAPTIAAALTVGLGAGAVGWYVSIAAVVSLLCTVWLPETRRVTVGLDADLQTAH
ncbi:MAG TPA: MFS transporter [Pseudonocardiaceae bacterium]|nr:MFS transporter [Pseudonocardiaceae bacterium]